MFVFVLLQEQNVGYLKSGVFITIALAVLLKTD